MKIVSALSLHDVLDLVGVGVGIARIASMSLISARPMIVWLSLWRDGHGQLLVRRWLEGGKDEGLDEGSCRFGLAEVDVLGRGQEVDDDETGQQLDQPGALAAAEVAVDQRGEEHAWRCG